MTVTDILYLAAIFLLSHLCLLLFSFWEDLFVVSVMPIMLNLYTYVSKHNAYAYEVFK